jgi:adenine-specific DNA-methyltransferase
MLGQEQMPDEPLFPKSIHTVEDCLDVSIDTAEGGRTVLDYFAGSGTTGHALMRLNEKAETENAYVMVEQGAYFDTVLLPRLKKAAFSDQWSEGVPQARDGRSHVLKYHRLESYEDVLNNLEIDAPSGVQRQVFDAWDDYEMRYMLVEETAESETLLQPEAFEAPFDYTLRIRHGMESPTQHAVDLEATFNHLIGLRVETRRVHHHGDDGRRYVVVTGTVTRDGAVEDVMVLWRDRAGLDDAALRDEKAWVEAEVIGDSTFDTVYVNGTSFIEGAEPLEIPFRERMDSGR